MPIISRSFLVSLSLLLLPACQQQIVQQHSDHPVKSRLVQENGQYQIYRNDQPYFIKGGGGSGDMALLKASGGNSVRTWSTDNAQQVLDSAQANGLTVMMGLRLGHERHGFDYDDAAAVAAQKEQVRQQVLKYKDHPALLVWGIGNEVDLFYTNTNVWYAIEDIAQMIKQLDPNHLVTTVTAGIDKAKTELIMQRVPSIDYLSINTYGGLEALPQQLLDYGYKGAYSVTEWGPTGHWEVAKTDWDVPIEQTSSEKAASYRSRYQGGVLGAPQRALGSYAFLWGQKQETTPTWYGVFTEQGYPNEIVDSLQYLWTGEWPANRAPSIDDYRINEQHAIDSIHLQPDSQNQARVDIIDHGNDKLTVSWEILPESTDIKAGGDPEARPEPLTGLFNRQDSDGNLSFTAPAQSGAYRLFVTIRSEDNKVANANIPFYVNK
ncbi:glycoside hydrolase family 2 TIM barrel-domain containing protein [Neptunicella sp. SCSIO 80796]|uniref:glycoside hydrolase family 2 TIM barrel-domain containing protein n=1 Tax=Neptunicella plasticusilytica TaxID=3117012 RepID=UPI003A4D391A